MYSVGDRCLRYDFTFLHTRGRFCPGWDNTWVFKFAPMIGLLCLIHWFCFLCEGRKAWVSVIAVKLVKLDGETKSLTNLDTLIIIMIYQWSLTWASVKLCMLVGEIIIISPKLSMVLLQVVQCWGLQMKRRM